MGVKIKVHFFGAAGTVTGSKFLLETPKLNILIDCGMFQGLKELRLLNWAPLPFSPDKIDVVLLTMDIWTTADIYPDWLNRDFTIPFLGLLLPSQLHQ